MRWALRSFEGWPDATALCALAQRCAPSDLNRLYAGTDWALNENHRTALEIFSAVLANPFSLEAAGVAYSQIGFCYDAMGRLPESVDAWRGAHRAIPHRHDVLCFWFGLAIRCGADKDISESNARISEALSNEREASHHSVVLQKKKSLGFWVSDDTSADSIRRWNSRLCEPARELAYALS
jgi:hypothetical protein